MLKSCQEPWLQHQIIYLSPCSRLARKRTHRFLFSCFWRQWIYLEKPLCFLLLDPHHCRDHLVDLLLEWWSSWTNLPGPDWSPALSSCPWLPVALVHEIGVPRALQSHPPALLLPWSQAGNCREPKQLSKAVSSAMLMAKELHQIREIDTLDICPPLRWYWYNLACILF